MPQHRSRHVRQHHPEEPPVGGTAHDLLPIRRQCQPRHAPAHPHGLDLLPLGITPLAYLDAAIPTPQHHTPVLPTHGLHTVGRHGDGCTEDGRVHVEYEKVAGCGSGQEEWWAGEGAQEATLEAGGRQLGPLRVASVVHGGEVECESGYDHLVLECRHQHVLGIPRRLGPLHTTELHRRAQLFATFVDDHLPCLHVPHEQLPLLRRGGGEAAVSGHVSGNDAATHFGELADALPRLQIPRNDLRRAVLAPWRRRLPGQKRLAILAECECGDIAIMSPEELLLVRVLYVLHHHSRAA
mmetsp:Transcript_32710/g.81017  ORF Transcript_32710/g.81017 Transcript_32710/m.81017 type:complete len:296 (+) Transcript_32710:1091-1978(+)